MFEIQFVGFCFTLVCSKHHILGSIINWWWFIVYDQSKQSSLHMKTLPTFVIEWLCCLFFPTICFSKLKLWGFPHSGSVFARLERYQFEFQLFNIFSVVVWVRWQQPTLSRSYLQICFLASRHQTTKRCVFRNFTFPNHFLFESSVVLCRNRPTQQRRVRDYSLYYRFISR
jgi:hypothetical protein